MSYEVAIQNITQDNNVPTTEMLQRWVRQTLPDTLTQVDLTIRIVAEKEARALNRQYRQKDYATNVLSFAYEHDTKELSGDIVLCASVISAQAEQQNINPEHHWAHLVVHGLLHLLGHDHDTENQADIMQQMEIDILQQLNYPNPYREETI
ncbi:MAG: rRNA maturation RNase YbeY [Pseudomonadota bacterium]